MKSNKKTEISRKSGNDLPNRNSAIDLTKRSGRMLCPIDLQYQGSGVVHFYANKTDDLFAFIATTTGFENIPEPQCSAGIRELSRACMERYGRKPPETIDPQIKLVK